MFTINIHFFSVGVPLSHWHGSNFSISLRHIYMSTLKVDALLLRYFERDHEKLGE